jgi:hypothetical protein
MLVLSMVLEWISRPASVDNEHPANILASSAESIGRDDLRRAGSFVAADHTCRRLERQVPKGWTA